MIGNWLVVTSYQPWEISLSFPYGFQRHEQEMTQIKLALEDKLKLSFVYMTKLVLFVQGIFKAGLSLLLVVTISSPFGHSLNRLRI